MGKVTALVLLSCLAVISAFPAEDPVLAKLDQGLRYSYLEDDQGKAHLVDNWIKLSDFEKMSRYNPDSTNRYHLFTRANPSISQPLVLNDVDRVRASNFDGSRRTIVLMHGFAGSVTSGFNTVLVPAFLAADDCNVIVLDWSSGSHWGPNAARAGEAAGRFFSWLNQVTGASPGRYHVAGYSVGGHGAAIVARNIEGDVGYVTGLDPADRWDANETFRPNDAVYTEVLHTSTMGNIEPMGQVDFYANGGTSQPGCMTSLCNHYRSYYFLAESLIRGGFTGTSCLNLQQATSNNCNQVGRLQFGGIQPKNGNSGIFHFRTNPFSPFSQG